MSAQTDLEDWQSRFTDLAPFVKEDMVQVGGRLKNAPLAYEDVHPILLPASNPISKLIMQNVHIQVAHGGPERPLSESCCKFWMTRGWNLAKNVVKYLFHMQKASPATTQYPNNRFASWEIETIFSSLFCDWCWSFGPLQFEDWKK